MPVTNRGSGGNGGKGSTPSGYSGGYSGSYGGSGGGGKSSSTTKNYTGKDRNNLATIKATTAANIKDMLLAADADKQTYKNKLAANKALAANETRQNQRTADSDWYESQQKLQAAAGATRKKMGNSAYGTGLEGLQRLTSTADDISDAKILTNQQEQQNTVNQDLFTANTEADASYASAVNSNRQNLSDALYSFIQDYSNNLGSMQKIKNNSKTSGGSSSSKTTADNETYITTNPSPFLINEKKTKKANGKKKKVSKTDKQTGVKLDSMKLNYGQLQKALGLKGEVSKSQMKSGKWGLSAPTKPRKLQEQSYYRSAEDTNAALQRRYGGGTL